MFIFSSFDVHLFSSGIVLNTTLTPGGGLLVVVYLAVFHLGQNYFPQAISYVQDNLQRSHGKVWGRGKGDILYHQEQEKKKEVK